MKNYIFRCMWEDEDVIFHVCLEAKSIKEAREKFNAHMKRCFHRPYCLFGVYREV